MALNRGVRNEVVQMRVVRELRCFDDRWRVVHELAEESESLPLVEPRQTEIADLHFEALGLVLQRTDGPIEFRLQDLQRSVRREPGTKRLSGGLPQVAECSA